MHCSANSYTFVIFSRAPSTMVISHFIDRELIVACLRALGDNRAPLHEHTGENWSATQLTDIHKLYNERY